MLHRDRWLIAQPRIIRSFGGRGDLGYRPRRNTLRDDVDHVGLTLSHTLNFEHAPAMEMPYHWLLNQKRGL